ncbi:hypothetical protein PACTADRAFT_51880 [Pachysolen tannophilus NRRL Y-2460]|uniref:Large ribosomal subunit protein mL53 n=1 Tax=Pachysolen tannophilus NRRL Y-2460 TaxID=669874 RepID=A0A1E4TNB8_PACTA|nr:hypothetical protein PACTADRAFT_51880 [Pachysolen tannophilus NRRL Y-2460]
MITKYFTKVVVKFNPFGKEGKSSRLFLAAIPPALRGQCQIDYEVLTKTSKNKPIIKVSYKDKKTLEADPVHSNFEELAAYFDRHSRKLKLDEAIKS